MLRPTLTAFVLAAAAATAWPADPAAQTFSEDAYTRQAPFGRYRPDATVYRRVTLAGCARTGYQDGPSAGSMIFSAKVAADDAGNVYWKEHGAYAVIRKYDAKTGRVNTFAGSAQGRLDGPLEVARFTSGAYMSCDGVEVTPDGKWLYVADSGSDGILRLIDVAKGWVSTIDPAKVSGVAAFTVAPDGDCYAVGYKGAWKVSTDGVVQALNLDRRPKEPGVQYGGSAVAHGLAIDAVHGELYAMAREGKDRFWSWNLATGKVTVRLDSGPGPWCTAKLRKEREAGPLVGTCFHCPSGVSLRPGEEGKTWYWGGGDDPTFYRVNLAGQYDEGFMPIGDEKFVFGLSRGGMTYGHVCTWAGAPVWDSRGNLYAHWGIWPKVIMFRPVKP